MSTRSWKDIKDEIYGEKGTPRRDKLELESHKFLSKIKFFQMKKDQVKNQK
jgi:hypothetical protein